ncbi:MAG: methyltransferase [Christensenella sp.]|nr:methyltransferase [Christensenella sp.]
MCYTHIMERMDDLQHNGLVLYQDTDYACFNADALLLTGFLRLTQRDTVAELGSGTGVVCVLGADNTGARFTGVERQACLVELAQKSVAKNGQEIRFLCADVADAPELLGRGAFSAVVMNPPYFTSGEESPNRSRSAARHDDGDTLRLFLRAAFQLLNNGGRLFAIYPADALATLINALCTERLEPKRMRPVYSGGQKNALRVLVEAKKHAKPGLMIEPPEHIKNIP